MKAQKSHLLALTKDLLAEWDHTKHYWSDAKSLEFEKRYLDELQAAVNVAVNNIDALERVLAKIREDCG